MNDNKEEQRPIVNPVLQIRAEEDYERVLRAVINGEPISERSARRYRLPAWLSRKREANGE